jgi:hypothetical protein
MVKLINHSRINFIGKEVAVKLIRRFWRTLLTYDKGAPYDEILKMYFSSLCKGAVKQHRQITNTNLDIEGEYGRQKEMK